MTVIAETGPAVRLRELSQGDVIPVIQENKTESIHVCFNYVKQ